MDSVSNDPRDALVFHLNRNCQDKLVDSACSESKPLDVSSVISSDGGGKESGQSSVEKIEIWVNGVKRVIFVPLGNNPTEPRIPSEPCNPIEQRSPNEPSDSVVAAEPYTASPMVSADAGTFSGSHFESCGRFPVVTSSAGEHSVLSKSVSTNTVDQLPNRCVATVAPQINHELGRHLVSSAFDEASKSKEYGITQAAAVIKQERLTSVTNCLNVRPESALTLGHKQTFIHQGQQHLTENQRLNLNEWSYQDRLNQLQRLGHDEPGRLPDTHNLTGNAIPGAGLHSYVTQSSSSQFVLPNPDSFNGHFRLPTQVPPYRFNSLQASVLASNSFRPSVSVSGRSVSNHFSGVLGMSEPTVGSKELCSNRFPRVPVQVQNLPLPSNHTVVVPNFRPQRYQHLVSALDQTKQPHRYGSFGAQDDARLSNVYAPLARFPIRGDFPYPQFPVRLSSNEQMAAQVVQGDFVHSQFPVRLPINNQMSEVTRHHLFAHHPNYRGSFVHAENVTRPELHVPFNEHPYRFCLSDASHYLQSIAIGQAAHASSSVRQPEMVPGGDTTLLRMHQSQPKISPIVPEMSQMHALPASYFRYSNLPGAEQVSSLRLLKGTEQPTSLVPSLLSHRLPSASVAQPFRPSPARHEITPHSNILQPTNHEITQSVIFQPMNGVLYNNASPLNVSHFTRVPHGDTAFSQSVTSCTQINSLSQGVTVPGLRIADEQVSSSLHSARYSLPSAGATFSQNLVSQSFLSPSAGILRAASQNLPAVHSQVFFSPYLQTLPFSDASKSQSDVNAQDHEGTGLQSHARSSCNSIPVQNTFRDCYNNCTETDGRTVPFSPSYVTSPAVCEPQPAVGTMNSVSMTLTSTEKSLDVTVAVSNNESSKSAEVSFREENMCSSDTALDASRAPVPEITVLTPPKSLLEPNSNLEPSELQEPQGQPSSLPGSPRSPMLSEIMNSIDKISDDLSMQKWLDSLIGNISDSSKDGFDSQAKSRTTDLPLVSETASKYTITAAGRSLVCPPSMTKQVGLNKNKRTWIGIKSIEAEMSPESSKVKAKRRKRRRLTMRSNQSPDGSCDASSDSWHPDSSASSESSVDSIVASIPSTKASGTESSWCSADSVTMGKRRKKRSRKSVSSRNHNVHSQRRRTRHLRDLSPWCRTRPCLGRIQGCFVSLEMLCLKGKTSINVKRANEFLCCSSKAKSCKVQGGSDADDSYDSWCRFKSKKRFLKRDSKRRRNTVRSGSESEDSHDSKQRSKNKNLIEKLRYSKPRRNVVISGSESESACLQERPKTVRQLLKSKHSRPVIYMDKSGSDG